MLRRLKLKTSFALSLLVAIAVVACRTKSKETPADDASSTASSPSSTSSSASASSPSASMIESTESPAGTTTSSTTRSACTRAAYDLGMSDGRIAFKEKRYADAVASFRRAMVARPTDAKVRGELGYAELFNDSLEAADQDLRVGAELAASDPNLAAQIWFNRGLVAEKQSEPEIARACFSVSDRLHSTQATQQRLKGKNKCPVAIERVKRAIADPDPDASASTADVVEIVTGWKGVHAALVPLLMGGEDGERERAAPPPTTEENAKARICHSYSLSNIDEDNPCNGKPPWSIKTGHVMYRDFISEVTPLSRNRLALVHMVHGGGGPSSGSVGGDTQMAGDRLLVMTMFGEAHFVITESECVTEVDESLVKAGGIGYGDVRSLTTNSFTVYDTTSGRALVRGVSWGEGNADAIKLTPTELRVEDKSDAGACTIAVPIR